MGEMRRELIKKIIQEYNPKSVNDIHMVLKDLLGETLEGMLDVELDEELGYSKKLYS